MSKRFKSLLYCVILLGMTFFFITNIVGEFATTHSLKSNISLHEDELEKLTEEKEENEQLIDNLNDVNYIIRYAIGQYSTTKDIGDQVFKLPEE